MYKILGMYLVFIVLVAVLTSLITKTTLLITDIEIEHSWENEIISISNYLWKAMLAITFFLGLLLIYKGE